MKVGIWMKLDSDPKISNYLKENSEWYKYLNRNPINYNRFIKSMKEQNKINTANKINGFMDNIDMVSSILKVLK